jgi:hypothetical protein
MNMNAPNAAEFPNFLKQWHKSNLSGNATPAEAKI